MTWIFFWTASISEGEAHTTLLVALLHLLIFNSKYLVADENILPKTVKFFESGQ